MAESVKRRVAAARLAVAFVAAGTIAGATSWAQAGPAPPTAHESAVDAFAKVNSIKSVDIVNGSLLLKDFKKGEVASGDQFLKLKSTVNGFEKAQGTIKGEVNGIKGELGELKSDVGGIKGELGDFLKASDADARYIKMSDQVMRGDGSVHTATGLQTGNEAVSLLGVSGIIAVDGLPGSKIQITNNSDQPLTHTACNSPSGGTEPAGVLEPGKSLICDGSANQLLPAVQMIGAGASPIVMTLNFSSIPLQVGAPQSQDTVQILIGL